MTTELERQVMQKMGSKGGKNSAARLTPEERLERALNAVRARWGSDNDAAVAVRKKTPPKSPKPQKAAPRD